MIPIASYEHLRDALHTWVTLLDQCSEGQGLNSRVDQLLRGSVNAIGFAALAAREWLKPGKAGVDPATITDTGRAAMKLLSGSQSYDIDAEVLTLRELLADVITVCDAVSGEPTPEDFAAVIAAHRAIATFIGGGGSP